MQRNEGPAYHGRPVGGIPPEVSWIPDAARSNSAPIHFDPTSEHCSRTAPENPSSKHSRGPLSNLLGHHPAASLPLAALKSHTIPTAALTSLAMNASQMSASVATSTSSGGGSGSHSQSPGSSGGGSGALGSSGNSASVASSQFQRLKVEDALSYLDQVKLQFGNHPQVYNDFLDIMKEFKSQSIDTPGVISRVSNLFKGHPDLIVGFNTFLPPGFKIEVHQNEINISGPAQHSQTLAKIAQAHNSSNAVASSAKESSGHSQSNSTQSNSNSTSRSSGGAAGGTASSGSSNSGPNQPVEFNHAISYVNKIKNRFQQHPDIYKQFLEILHKYQKEQRQLKEGGGSAAAAAIPLTESEVYTQVSSLFQNQDDLLAEFGQFLPDATSVQVVNSIGPPPSKKPALSSNSSKSTKPAHGRKSSQSSVNSSGNSQGKKPKSSAKDVLAEAGKHTNYVELALFDKIQKAFHNQEVYTNFLRCLVLFNEEIISRHELVQLVTPFLGKFPELFNSFKTLLGFKDPGLPEQLPTASPTPLYPPKERVTDFAAEIDYKSLKRHGASYRALPKTYVQPKCSGRTHLCNDVLNDTWVSFPMWSEDSTFEGTRKTQFEEYIFRCEDERFELDVVLETNLSTIRYLEALQKKLSKMAPEDLSKFSLEDTIGGHSNVLQRKAIHRIYGDKAHDIIEGLKRSPSVAVPVVLKRLKAKQEEWLEAQKAFNKTWRDQLEKYYLKSLDHQGINFKPLDTRAMRSKALCAEVESIYDERQEQMAEGASPSGPHLKLFFPAESCVFTDAVGLVMYYTKRASSLQHSDALKIKSFLTHTLSSLLYYPRVELNSEDDLSPDSDSDTMDVDSTSLDATGRDKRQGGPATNGRVGTVAGALVPDTSPQFVEMDYHIMFANNSLYTLFRLFQMLCDRLNKIYQQALISIKEEEQKPNTAPIAIQLGLKKPPDIRVEEYYPTFLSMAKNFMEGNIDASTYEDTCREMFGVHAYVVFTIDRLVQNIVRQLHTLVSDENCYKMMEHYAGFVEQLTATHLRVESRVGVEATYQKAVESLLGDDNCFKIMFDKEHLISFELLDTDENGEESNGHDMKRWQAYVEKYGRHEEGVDPELKEILAKRKIFLKRSLRSCPSSSENEEKLKALLPNMEICGAIEFKMDKKSYRMIPLAKSEDYLYNKQSLKRARQVNDKVLQRKRAKFQSWHSKWLAANLTTQESTLCADWLLGKVLQSTEGADGVVMTGSSPLTECTKELYLGVERSRYTTRLRKPPPPPSSGPTEPPEAMSTD